MIRRCITIRAVFSSGPTRNRQGKEVNRIVFDIHYHLLYGVDDGPKTLEDSLALAEASIREGVTHIVATPHANHRYPFNPEIIEEKIAEMRQHLGGRIILGSGCDFHLTYDNIADATSNPGKYSINAGAYLLVELPDHAIPPGIDDGIFRLQKAGLIPIITHPERNPVLLKTPQRLENWVQSGCLVQVTASSLLGRFGKQSAAMSILLLGMNWVHFISSDAHSLQGRPPEMAAAFEFLETKYGNQTAERLCIENPRAAFLNEKLPAQPYPLDFVLEQPGSEGGILRRFFKRVSG